MPMERWEKLLYYPLVGLAALSVIGAVIWVLVLKKEFSEEPIPDAPATASSEQQPEKKQPVVPSAATKPRVKPPALPDVPGLRPVNKTPQEELFTSKGTFERAAKITEQDEFYQEEYTNVRIKGPRTKPKLVDSDKPHIKWKTQLGGSVSGIPVVYGGKLYFGCYDYQLLCLDEKTGELVFQAKTSSQAIGSAHKYGSNVIVAQRNGNISAFDLNTGKREWNHRIAVDKPKDEIDISISGITLIGMNMYVSKHWGSLYILGAGKGRMKSVANLPYESRINLPAIALRGNLFFSNVAGEIMSFSMNGDTSHWKHQIDRGYPVTMKRAYGKLLIATSEQEFFAMDPSSREFLWRMNVAGWAFDAMTAKDNVLYLAAGSLYAIDAEKGSIIWKKESSGARGFCRGAPIVEGGVVYACEEEGVLRVMEKASGIVQETYEIGGAIRNGIAKSGNLIFVSTTDREMIAVDVSK